MEKQGVINKLAFSVTRDKQNKNWKSYTRRPDLKMIEETMPKPGDDTILLFCGSKEFRNDMGDYCTELGHDP